MTIFLTIFGTFNSEHTAGPDGSPLRLFPVLELGDLLRAGRPATGPPAILATHPDGRRPGLLETQKVIQTLSKWSSFNPKLTLVFLFSLGRNPIRHKSFKDSQRRPNQPHQLAARSSSSYSVRSSGSSSSSSSSSGEEVPSGFQPDDLSNKQAVMVDSCGNIPAANYADLGVRLDQSWA